LFSKRQSLHHRPAQFLNRSQPLRNRARQPVRDITNIVVRIMQSGFADNFCDGHAALSQWQATVATGSARRDGGRPGWSDVLTLMSATSHHLQRRP